MKPELSEGCETLLSIALGGAIGVLIVGLFMWALP
jgi:hypothetical protein